jgi:hypothetical protein
LPPKRIRIGKIFNIHIDKAVEELGAGYDVTVQGRFDKTPCLYLLMFHRNG